MVKVTDVDSEERQSEGVYFSFSSSQTLMHVWLRKERKEEHFHFTAAFDEKRVNQVLLFDEELDGRKVRKGTGKQYKF